ncbi:hypothetical protein SAMN02799630_05127 [Paenibacillus sp. UNCCL117]|uniref:hypothetical protein n=1 Tax=unclassified Paenibacillus TaxID=185978 RepID=UPI0008901B85|nr:MULTISPECIES: hypothetical protein [unclassified Paenibacillus]SDE29236.1 hypothetical protein SAMN04488602_12430 [Paenibacillus sp. cl123]SFW63313.1 hypothetical protein SAMN02799630_05127 [Paenibacillus sp. UNCCL117]
MGTVKIRFIERDYFRSAILENSEHLSDQQVEKVLDSIGKTWVDYTFKFFENGSMTITDNDTDLQVPLSELKGASYDFYVKQRIKMIKENLLEKILQSA